MAKLNKDITLVNPTDLVNDQNANAAPKEIQENINYILNYLNGNKALLSGIFGNLWDYNGEGKRILANGGRFDTFKKCNSWKSLTDFKVSNDTEISFDSANNKCVYEGRSAATVDREKWIERDIWIPETLRDQQLYFSIKAAGCTSKTGWTTANSTFETIAIQILGGSEDVQTFKTVGAWNNHDYYANESYAPGMITAHVPFKTSKSTTSVKVKIFRTVNTGYLHIDKTYVGGIAAPYDNAIETYDLVNLDINELFDYDNGITKVISTGVMGHKVPDKFEKIRGSDLVTFESMMLFLRSWLTQSSGQCNMKNLSGSVDLDTTSKVYTITNSAIESDDAPVVTLELPTFTNELGHAFVVVSTGTSGASGYDITIFDDCTSVPEVTDALSKNTSGDCEFCLACITEEVTGAFPTYKTFQCGYWRDIRVDGVVNLKDGQFQVLLSDAAPTSGYKLNWQINKLDCTSVATTAASGVGNYFSPALAIDSLNLPAESDEPTPTVYPNIFDHTSDLQ
jgi:hypothetical protein